MRQFKVYFEIFGKKMRVNILAADENEARQKVLEKVNFRKVEEDSDDVFNEVIDLMDAGNEFLDKLIELKESNNPKKRSSFQNRLKEMEDRQRLKNELRGRNS